MRVTKPIDLPRAGAAVALGALLAAGCWRPAPLTTTAPTYEAEPVVEAPPAPPPPPPDEHLLTLHRPFSVGDEHLVLIQAREAKLAVGTVRGRIATRESSARRVTLRARQTVLAVNDVGNIATARFEVQEATEQTAEGERVLLRPGQAFVVTRAVDGGTLALEEGTLPPAVEDSLRLAVGDRVLLATDDDTVGHGDPLLVGDTWPLHREAIVAGYDALGELRFLPESLTGESRLEADDPVDGIPAVTLSTHFTARPVERVTPPENGAHRGGSLEVTYRLVVPESRGLPVLRSELTLIAQLDYTVTPRRGDVVDLHEEIERSRVVELRPAP